VFVRSSRGDAKGRLVAIRGLQRCELLLYGGRQMFEGYLKERSVTQKGCAVVVVINLYGGKEGGGARDRNSM